MVNIHFQKEFGISNWLGATEEIGAETGATRVLNDSISRDIVA